MQLQYLSSTQPPPSPPPRPHTPPLYRKMQILSIAPTKTGTPKHR